MKNYCFLAVVAILASPSLALGQSSPNPPSDSQNQGNGQQFQQHKDEILKRISARLSEIQQRKSCVEAANNRQALEACMPRGQGQRRGQGQGQGQGQERGQERGQGQEQ
ncbi:hypothetical protein [Nostoc punctiforme]|uniref:Uncharacterized protein n=1 Tax=Nostoc punctiforme (strain ATCC 29133 / PCC 73102) TaxID=63737 RepID=B2JB11_NOSP7|nr:hypothetical protein [Nostoc punctiforme]ACC85115.1 hypothetical protein Npun_AR260 [Nostoc punctiforme PCC 73102]